MEKTSGVRYPLCELHDQISMTATNKMTRTMIRIVMHHPDLVSAGESTCQGNDDVEKQAPIYLQFLV